MTAAAAPPEPTPAPRVERPRRVDPNKAFEPPPGWIPPQQMAAASTPAPTPTPTPAPAPSVSSPTPMPEPRAAVTPPPAPSGPVTQTPIPPPPVVTAPAAPPTPPVTVQSTPPAAPSGPIMADIPRAQSGAVPNGTLKAPASPLQIAVIQFNRASSGLGGNDLAILSRVAQIQRKNGGTVRIVAHAAQDASGSSADAIEQGNYEVSKRRALAIANQLMALGVPKSSIIAEAASDNEPIYETNTARGLAANRRAEISLDF